MEEIARSRLQRPQPSSILLTQQLAVAKRIGKGSLGSVYAAIHQVLARRFAVKVIHLALTQEKARVKRLTRIVREVSQLAHPNVVALEDFGRLEDGHYYITMDYVHGLPLEQALLRQGRFSPERALALLQQLGDALAAAHALHLLHADIKPSNILLRSEQDRPETLALTDFGLTTVLSPLPSATTPRAHLVVRSRLNHLAPEQILGERLDARTDVYGWGAVAYHLLTGEPPFIGTSEQLTHTIPHVKVVPPSRRAGVDRLPRALDDVVVRCLEKDPRDRYASIKEVAQALVQLDGPSRRREIEEELSTQRWQVTFSPYPAEARPPSVALPQSPTRLRQLFHETILELGFHLEELGVIDAAVRQALHTLRDVRVEAAQTAAQMEITENRFEDIRRELNERAATLRYDLLDLNLARREVRDGKAAEQLAQRIVEIEVEVAQLGTKRRERFAGLNHDLHRYRERLRILEEQMAQLYRQVYDGLLLARRKTKTAQAGELYRQLDLCRQALRRAPLLHTPWAPEEEIRPKVAPEM